MRKVDFSTVMKLIIANCRENMHTKRNRETAYSQYDLICDIFFEQYNECDETYFDSTAVSRWIKGNRPVPAAVVNYYRDNGSESIGRCFRENCLDIVFDLNKLYEDIITLVKNDYLLSEEKKNELLPDIDNPSEDEICNFIGNVIFTAIDRPFIPSNTEMLPTSAVAVSEYIFGVDVPLPCRYFCGRGEELDTLHTEIQKHSKIFISGFAGIGKSEFAKAYAKKFKKEYKNILYFNYTGSLKEMITDIDFVGDNAADDEKSRFTKHIRFLKSLRSDSLIIIDNFNVTNDSFLSTLLNYGCKMIFRTRSNMDCGHIFNLNVMENTEELYRLVSKFYSYADENKSVIYELIKAVHHHTLSVEMIAKLFEKGLHTADEILVHLQNNSVNPEFNDKIKVIKDGENSRNTYYNHIRSLFSLYLLDEQHQSIMRNMVFFDEVRIRYLAKMLDLDDTNRINELCELGFIGNTHADLISLHPMIRDVVVLDLKPSLENCNALLSSLKAKILILGYELSDSAIVISCIKNVMKYIIKDDLNAYLLLLENAFAFLDNYKEYDLMQIVLSETENVLDNKQVGTDNDRALLLNNKAMMLRNKNEKIPHAISMMNKALSLCDQNENPVLFANINMNLGLLHIDNHDVERGLEFMDKAYLFIKLCRAYNDDFITIAINYAETLSENNMRKKALEVLLECEYASEGCKSNNHAKLIYDIGIAYIPTRNYSFAITKLNSAFAEYSEIGCYEEITARKIAAAKLMQKYGLEYPKEWETDYLE